MQRLLLLGMNHKTAPLSVRERLAFSAEQRRAALEQFRTAFPECEVVLLSTCNRVEIYVARAVHGHPRMDELTQFFGAFHGIDLSSHRSHFYELSQQAVVEHLFQVAASLDSMVFGESEILGQVRSAYEAAGEVGTTGSVLNPLFQRAIAAGKQVMTELGPVDEEVSVASVGVDLARHLFDDCAGKTLMTVGAGDVTQQVLRYFRQLRPARLLICNRDAEKAHALAGEFGGTAVDFGVMDRHLSEADILITSTAAPTPILTRRQFELAGRRRQSQPMLVIDLAVPRDVEPAVRELKFVHLHDMDDLQRTIATSRTPKPNAFDVARQIVQSHVQQFLEWQRARAFGPAIDALYRRYHDVAEEELQRTLGRGTASADEADRLHEFARRIVNKLLHDPVQAMRADDVSPGQYLGALQKLFKLELPPDEKK